MSKKQGPRSVTRPPPDVVATLRKLDKRDLVDQSLSALYSAYYAQTKDPGIYLFEIMRRLDELMQAYDTWLG